MQRVLAQLNHVPLRLILLVLMLMLVASIIGPGVARADPGWYDTDWDYRKKITLLYCRRRGNQAPTRD